MKSDRHALRPTATDRLLMRAALALILVFMALWHRQPIYPPKCLAPGVANGAINFPMMKTRIIGGASKKAAALRMLKLAATEAAFTFARMVMTMRDSDHKPPVNSPPLNFAAMASPKTGSSL